MLFVVVFYTTYLYSRYNLTPSVHNFLSNNCFLQYDYLIVFTITLLYYIALNIWCNIYNKIIKFIKFFKKKQIFLNNYLFFFINLSVILYIYYKIYTIGVYKEIIFTLQLHLILTYFFIILVKINFSSFSSLIFFFFINYFDFILFCTILNFKNF